MSVPAPKHSGLTMSAHRRMVANNTRLENWKLVRRSCKILLLLSVGVVAAGVASPAGWAATASVETDEFGDRFLTYRADPGETNDLTASWSATGSATGTVTILDNGATIVAGTGCNAVTQHEVECPSIFDTDVLLDDGDDRATTTTRFLVDGGAGADTIEGSFAGGYAAFGGPGNDTLIGASLADGLFGGSGDDTLLGHEDNDIFFPGPGNDIVDGGPGRDHVSLYDASSPVTIDLVAETVMGQGNDTVSSIEDAQGSRFGDVFVGDARDNFFISGPGADVAFGGGGADVLMGGSQSEENPGDDRLYGGAGNDHLLGSSGADLLRGGLGRDRLQGGAGNDYLRARDGERDALFGALGVDRATTDSIDAVRGVETRLIQ